jgi:nucleoside-diphosphate-sugar epimerase
VVHLAADAGGPVTATIEGTRNLLQMMVDAGVNRLVLASSFSVYDWDRVGNVLDEDCPVRQDDDDLQRYGDYARAKVLQEWMVRDHCEKRGWRLTIVRPGVVWGKESAYPAGLGHRVGPIHLVIGSGLSSRLTHVLNCADAFAAVLANERSVGQTFNVVDGHQIPDRVYLGKYLDSRGGWAVRIPLPYGFVLAGVRLIHALAICIGVRDRLPSIMVPCRFRSRFRRVDCSAARICSILGWTAPYDLTECLEATFGRPVE